MNQLMMRDIFSVPHSSLKREIEQIERGELDNQLPAIWERMQA